MELELCQKEPVKRGACVGVETHTEEAMDVGGGQKGCQGKRTQVNSRVVKWVSAENPLHDLSVK